MNILLLLVTTLVLLGAIVTFYYYLLVLASALKAKVPPEADTYHNICILIPAHDEEKTIEKTILSCLDIEYPTEKHKLVVLADNCGDRTAQLARKYDNVTVIERTSDKRGKGYALAYAFEECKKYCFDAYLVLDADCQISKGSLTEVNNSIHAGCLAMQLDDISANPDDSIFSYALSVGNKIENDYFYKPKSNLGLSVILRGTGMVLTRKLLEEIPWDSSSITEDIEYSIKLFEKKINIKYIPNEFVSSDFPVNKDQMNIQRNRWAKGNVGFGKKHALSLMVRGIKEKSLLLLDAGFSFLVISKPLVLFFVFSLTGILFAINAMVTNDLLKMELWIMVIILILNITYYLIGVISLGINRKRLFYLIFSPVVALKLILITIRSMVEKTNLWTKTPRN